MIILVSGEANFAMTSTRLTLGGFTQPGVARSLIELPGNNEKGLPHRFIWIFPKPLFGAFETLGEVDPDFWRTSVSSKGHTKSYCFSLIFSCFDVKVMAKTNQIEHANFHY